LAAVDPDRKVPDLYFKMMDPELQVADLKAEVGELRSGGIPSNLTPGYSHTIHKQNVKLHQ